MVSVDLQVPLTSTCGKAEAKRAFERRVSLTLQRRVCLPVADVEGEPEEFLERGR